MNRELVELALHSEAQEGLIKIMPKQDQDRWRQHRQEIWGTEHGDRATARGASLYRDKPFMDERNMQFSGEHIMTRLGEAGVMVELPDGTKGPFGEMVKRHMIPAFWLPHRDSYATECQALDDHLLIKVDEFTFLYNRLGLSPVV